MFQDLNPDQYVSVNRTKTSTLKKLSEKGDFPIDSIEMENNCELFSTASKIAQQLKRMFDYVVGNWVKFTYGNQRFSGFIEEVTVKILYFQLCKQEVLQKN